MLPESHAKMAVRILKEEGSSIESLEAADFQLPLERISSASISLIDDTHCPSCTFVMNYIKKNVRDLNDAVRYIMLYLYFLYFRNVYDIIYTIFIRRK